MLQVQSCGSVKIVSLDRTRLLAELRRIADRIRGEHPEVVEVRLFGSLARGNHTGTSDVDVLIVVSSSGEPNPVRRALAYLPYLDLPVPLDLLVLTSDELRLRQSLGDPFVLRLQQESMPL
jgi:predicted nucleotidyltransferase